MRFKSHDIKPITLNFINDKYMIIAIWAYIFGSKSMAI
eukprot:UN22633